MGGTVFGNGPGWLEHRRQAGWSAPFDGHGYVRALRLAGPSCAFRRDLSIPRPFAPRAPANAVRFPWPGNPGDSRASDNIRAPDFATPPIPACCPGAASSTRSGREALPTSPSSDDPGDSRASIRSAALSPRRTPFRPHPLGRLKTAASGPVPGNGCQTDALSRFTRSIVRHHRLADER